MLNQLIRRFTGGGSAAVASNRLMVQLRHTRSNDDEDMLHRIREGIVPVMARIARVPEDRIAIQIGRDSKAGLTMSMQLPSRRSRG
jgi:septum formation topological specificity factor MinE